MNLIRDDGEHYVLTVLIQVMNEEYDCETVNRL